MVDAGGASGQDQHLRMLASEDGEKIKDDVIWWRRLLAWLVERSAIGVSGPPSRASPFPLLLIAILPSCLSAV